MPHFDRRIYLGLIAIVIGFIPLVFGSFLALQKVVTDSKDFISANAQELVLSERLRYMDSAQSAAMPVFVLTGESDVITRFEKANLAFDSLALRIQKSEQDPEVKILIQNIIQASHKLYALAEPGIRLRQRGASIHEVDEYFIKKAGPAENYLQALLDKLVARQSENLKDAKAHVASTVRWMVGGLLGLSLFALALFAFIGGLMGRMMKQKAAYDLAQETLLKQEQQLSRARKEVVEMVAHDLKNPLATIKMSVEMMLAEITDTADTRTLDFEEGLRIAQRSADAMDRLISGVLDHAKIESGQMMLEKTEIEIGTLTQQLVRRWQTQANKKGVKVTAQIKSDLLFGYCDLVRIEQVLSNLIGNALKFTPTGGKIIVSAQTSTAHAAGLAGQGYAILLSVVDSGPGIQASQLPHIFERFWQVKETAKLGTGLGLSIAKSIVEAHQGKIWVESDFGHGSIFFVSLPLSSTRAALDTKIESTTPTAPL